MPIDPASLGTDPFERASTRSERERRAGPHRAREGAVLLPLLGAFLLVSPVILVFAAPVTLFGIPLILIYLFGVWALLIGASALLSHRLAGRGQDP